MKQAFLMVTALHKLCLVGSAYGLPVRQAPSRTTDSPLQHPVAILWLPLRLALVRNEIHMMHLSTAKVFNS